MLSVNCYNRPKLFQYIVAYALPINNTFLSDTMVDLILIFSGIECIVHKDMFPADTSVLMLELTESEMSEQEAEKQKLLTEAAPSSSPFMRRFL